MIRRIGVLTSGGDAPGMNAAIRAVTRSAIVKGLEVFGIHDGYLGMYENRIERLYRKSVSEKMRAGGTFLGTARLVEFDQAEVRQVALENLRNFNIEGLVVIGGDGSYRGGLALSKMGMPVVGVPGTIDNDIGGTDYTIGFDTAINTAVEAVDKLRDTSNSHRRCSIIEVMGRNRGDIAVWTAMAVGAEVCICKEFGFNLQEVIENVRRAAQSKRHAIIIVAENMVKVEELAQEVSAHTPFEARATVLGHVQRGGSPTVRDRVFASVMGATAVEALLSGKDRHCVCYRDGKIVVMTFEEALVDDQTDLLEKFEIFKLLW
ncbi:MAG: 6-phosphofructokinase [Bacillota bacterium]|jgi:6-phosphofructokinase 1|nr:6-phosphofructokinase [Bacillota bacterium]NLM31328.1 6-phosphofructokinase [Acholeplasmataceae bacterium]HOA78428.1 6-phosphofructokinase [Bacilli bacterium]HPZ27539.1 6-phosphofructokinase [Bacilli bacterium]HQC89579.1 6-phosphofructokinase [Bacilli bacterium]